MTKKFVKLPEKIKKKIVSLERKKHHPFIHHIHKKHRISHKTLLYMKEYGPRSHVYHVIIKESLKILIIASILSSIGGLSLELIENKIVTVLPLIILLPALNTMIGSYGTIVSSKFTSYLYTKKMEEKWWRSGYIRSLFFTVFLISIFSAVYIGLVSSFIGYAKGFALSADLALKVLEVSLISTLLLVGLIFTVSVTLGLYFYKKQEDPNNFLIPITTSIADFGSMLIFFGMVSFLF